MYEWSNKFIYFIYFVYFDGLFNDIVSIPYRRMVGC